MVELHNGSFKNFYRPIGVPPFPLSLDFNSLVPIVLKLLPNFYYARFYFCPIRCDPSGFTRRASLCFFLSLSDFSPDLPLPLTTLLCPKSRASSP
jgi:hypothetical protein